MTAQLVSGCVDAADVAPNCLSHRPGREDEVRIVRAGTLQVVHHQVATVPLHCGLEALDGVEEVSQITFRQVGAVHRDPAATEPVRGFSAGGGPFIVSTRHTHPWGRKT